MNIAKLARRLISKPLLPAFSLMNYAQPKIETIRLNSRILVKPPALSSRIIFLNSNMKPQKDPKKNKKPNWRETFDQKLKIVRAIWDTVYNTKISTLSIILGSMMLITMYLIAHDNYSQQVTTKEFANLIDSNCFKEVVFVEKEFFSSNDVKAKRVEGTINNQTFYCQVSSFEKFYELVMRNPNVKYRNQRRSGKQEFLHNIFLGIDCVSLVVILLIIAKQMKSGGMMTQMGMNQGKKFQITKNVKVKFKDVAGLHQVKRQVQQIVDFLKFPAKYTSLGATIPKGVLLTGPPGTGKTLLAKACAGEAGVPFYSVSGSDFVEMFVGVGAARVRELFQQAKSTDSPAIIFIDQLDAIGKKRMNKLGGNDERQSTLNQLLVEMDGFGTSNKVVVMGATNRKQILDNALVRPGRFDREVQVGLPDLKGRFQIFKVHLLPLKLSAKYTMDDYAKRLASLTPGFSGAEIANLCNQAAILSARHGKQVVQMIDFQLSSERVIGGVERKGFVSLEEKKTVAYHQCGHAVVSWFLEGADPLLKVTIIPRSKGALGFAQYFLNENELKTKQQIYDRICFILGGRCAQKHFFQQVTTGAYDDLSKAYELAYSMIAKYGMVPELGYVSYPDIEYTKPYGEVTEAAIDREIRKIIHECTERTKKMVAEHEQDIKRLAEQLLVKETLDVRSIQKILGKRPFPPNKTFQAYLETSEAS